MDEITHSTSPNVCLEEVIGRLSTNKTVAGILQIGSLRDGHLSAESDYDLVIALEEIQKRWFVGVSTIDHRFTDLIFVSQLAVQ